MSLFIYYQAERIDLGLTWQNAMSHQGLHCYHPFSYITRETYARVDMELRCFEHLFRGGRWMGWVREWGGSISYASFRRNEEPWLTEVFPCMRNSWLL